MNRAITISREYGSGGREIGEKLARRLGIPFYDKELIAMIAKEGNIETSVLEANDEVDPDFDNYSPRQVPPDYQIAMTQRIYAAQATVIRNLNDKGPCVIVGRCADYVLRENKNCLHVYVYANHFTRMDRIIKQYGVDPAKAADTLVKQDKQRANYYNFYSNKKWADMNNYDLVVNSSLFGIDGSVDVIKAALENAEKK